MHATHVSTLRSRAPGNLWKLYTKSWNFFLNLSHSIPLSFLWWCLNINQEIFIPIYTFIDIKSHLKRFLSDAALSRLQSDLATVKVGFIVSFFHSSKDVFSIFNNFCALKLQLNLLIIIRWEKKRAKKPLRRRLLTWNSISTNKGLVYCLPVYIFLFLSLHSLIIVLCSCMKDELTFWHLMDFHLSTLGLSINEI